MQKLLQESNSFHQNEENLKKTLQKVVAMVTSNLMDKDFLHQIVLS